MAFHLACDQRDYQVAERLLGVVEAIARRRQSQSGSTERRAEDRLLAAHARLATLRGTTRIPPES